MFGILSFCLMALQSLPAPAGASSNSAALLQTMALAAAAGTLAANRKSLRKAMRKAMWQQLWRGKKSWK